MRYIFVIFIGFVLLGCQTDKDVIRDSGGANIGKAKWTDVQREQSKISVIGDNSIIVERKRNQLPDRFP